MGFRGTLAYLGLSYNYTKPQTAAPVQLPPLPKQVQLVVFLIHQPEDTVSPCKGASSLEPAIASVIQGWFRKQQDNYERPELG